jgi:hypothetical protein
VDANVLLALRHRPETVSAEAVKNFARLGAQLRPEFPYFPNQPLRFQVQAPREQEDGAQARLAFAAFQHEMVVEEKPGTGRDSWTGDTGHVSTLDKE